MLAIEGEILEPMYACVVEKFFQTLFKSSHREEMMKTDMGTFQEPLKIIWKKSDVYEQYF